MMPLRPGFKYRNIDDYYYRNGRLYPHAPLTNEEQTGVLAGLEGLERFSPQIKECYYNAQRLALSGGFEYAEGYIMSERVPVPIAHAWAVYNGKPIDVTIRPLGESRTQVRSKILARIVRNIQENSYFGVMFPRKVISDIWRTEHMSRSVVDDWKGGFKLLRGNPGARRRR
jgi:hypothetical protein